MVRKEIPKETLRKKRTQTGVLIARNGARINYTVGDPASITRANERLRAITRRLNRMAATRRKTKFKSTRKIPVIRLP